MKNETNTETEKIIYYYALRFRDYSTRITLLMTIHSIFRAYLVTILKALLVGSHKVMFLYITVYNNFKIFELIEHECKPEKSYPDHFSGIDLFAKLTHRYFVTGHFFFTLNDSS